MEPLVTTGSCGFEASVSRAQRLLTHRAEPHHELRIVLESLDAEHGPDAELRVSNLPAEAQGPPPRPVPLFVRVCGRGLFAPPAAAVRVGSELVVREVSLVAGR